MVPILRRTTTGSSTILLRRVTLNYRHGRENIAMSNVPPEEELLAQFDGIKKSDRESMNRLYDAMFPSLYRYAAGMVGHFDAEEVVNDAMFVVWTDAIKFKGESKVATWIRGIVKNLCLKRYQKASAKKRESVTFVDNLELESASDETNPEPSVATLDEIEQLVSGLSHEHLRAITLIAEGRSYEEIADIEGCPKNTAKSRVLNARRLVKKKSIEINSTSSAGSKHEDKQIYR